MGYEIGSHLWGKGEDVPCAQDGGFGETREGKQDLPPGIRVSPMPGMVTLPEALWGHTRPAITSVAAPRPEVPREEATWGVAVAPCGGRSSTPEESSHQQRLRDSAVTHKVESTTKQHCRV